jgi:hypothetical protein
MGSFDSFTWSLLTRLHTSGDPRVLDYASKLTLALEPPQVLGCVVLCVRVWLEGRGGDDEDDEAHEHESFNPDPGFSAAAGQTALR